MQVTITVTDASESFVSSLASLFHTHANADEGCDLVCSSQCSCDEATNHDFEREMDRLLLDERYNYRTAKTLAEKLDVTADEVEQFVNENSGKYGFASRRSDNALMVFLKNRQEVKAHYATEEANELIDTLDKLLSGEYEYRTVKTLAAKTGKSEEFILHFVQQNPESYEVKTRRSDGAKLVGLVA